MSQLAIQTRDLHKAYRRRGRKVRAVDGFDMEVARGSVHGLLGPHGCGKSTVLRMLVGLSAPDRGDITVLGDPLPGNLVHAVARVGALIDSPGFSGDLTGRANLKLLARAAGAPRKRVDEVLDIVTLHRSSRRRVADYSIGMRQRLGVAAALLKGPELLVLDEPTHGLDPEGIRDMRDLVSSLGESGVTVLISSNILAEVQQICDSVTIMESGRRIAAGDVEDLIGDGAVRTRIEVAHPEQAAGHLSAAGYQVHADGDALVVEGHSHPEEITRLLAGRGLYVSDLRGVRPSLEAFYLQLTGRPTSVLTPDQPDPADIVDDPAEAAEREEDPA